MRIVSPKTKSTIEKNDARADKKQYTLQMKASRCCVLFLFFAVIFPLHADTDKTEILFIGDSHSVMGFGDSFYEKLNAKHPNEVATYSSCGSTMGYWYTGRKTTCGYRERGRAGTKNIPFQKLRSKRTRFPPTPILADLIKKHEPKLVVIQQGTNYIGAPKRLLLRDIHKLLNIMATSHASCIWIGPPTSRITRWSDGTGMNLADVNQTIKETLAKAKPTCEFIDSLRLTKYPARSGDGIHLDTAKGGKKIANQWGAKAAKKVLALAPPRQTAVEASLQTIPNRTSSESIPSGTSVR